MSQELPAEFQRIITLQFAVVKKIALTFKRLPVYELKKIKDRFCPVCHHTNNRKRVINTNCTCTNCDCHKLGETHIPMGRVKFTRALCDCKRAGLYTCTDMQCKMKDLSFCEIHLREHNEVVHGW